MDFLESEYVDRHCKKGNYTEKNLKSKNFTKVVFEGCDFTKSDFTGSRFLDCTFLSCNLSLVKLDGVRIQDGKFINCKLTGVNFTKCDKMFFSVSFKGCLIDTSNFSELPMKGVGFIDSVVRDTHFSGTQLQMGDFSGSDLKGSTFHNANLTKANFAKAINYSIDPLTNKLTKARFSAPEVLSLLTSLEIIIE